MHRRGSPKHPTSPGPWCYLRKLIPPVAFLIPSPEEQLLAAMPLKGGGVRMVWGVGIPWTDFLQRAIVRAEGVWFTQPKIQTAFGNALFLLMFVGSPTHFAHVMVFETFEVKVVESIYFGQYFFGWAVEHVCESISASQWLCFVPEDKLARAHWKLHGFFASGCGPPTVGVPCCPFRCY